MKQPITVNVSRELGNAGDVILTITDANDETAKLGVEGEGSTYGAIAELRPFFEGLLNGYFEPTDGTPHLVTNPDTDEVHIMVSNVDVTGPIPAKLLRQNLVTPLELRDEPPPSTPVGATSDNPHPTPEQLADRAGVGSTDASDVVAPTPTHAVEHDLGSTPDVTK